MVEGESFDLESGQVREEVTEVNEQDLGKTRDRIKKAKKVKKQIQDSQKRNKDRAGLLSILLQEITDDELMADIGEQLFTYELPVAVIFAQYMPYLYERRDLSSFFAEHEDIGAIWEDTPNTLAGYALYLGRLRASSEQVQSIPADEYISHVYRFFLWMELVDTTDWDEEKKRSFIDSLGKQLIG